MARRAPPTSSRCRSGSVAPGIPRASAFTGSLCSHVGLPFCHAQNSSAVDSRTPRRTSRSSSYTHSTAACAPDPPGPYTTVGIPAAASSAASIQHSEPV